MEGAVKLVWGLLAVASILAWAVLFKGLWLRFVDGPRIRKSLKNPATADRLTRELLQSASIDDADPSELSANFVRRVEAGVEYLSGFVIPWAPQLGLLGTALGLGAAMAGLAGGANGFDPEAALPGISTSLQTTIVGLIIASVGLAANRLLIVPSLSAIDESAVKAIRARRRKIAMASRQVKTRTRTPAVRWVVIPHHIDAKQSAKSDPRRVADGNGEAEDRAK